MKNLYGVIFSILVLLSLWIFNLSQENRYRTQLETVNARVVKLENTVECLAQLNHKTYFYIAPHKIDSKTGIINDEVHEVYDDRIANSECGLKSIN